MSVWSFCSQVCVCAKTDQAGSKVESTAVRADPAMGGYVKGDGLTTIGYQDSANANAVVPSNKNRLTVTAMADIAGAGDGIALAVEDPPALVAMKEQGTDSMDGPPLPTPKELFDAVQKTDDIFSLVQKGDLCAFGSSTPSQRSNRGKNAVIERDWEEKKLEIFGATNEADLRGILKAAGMAIHCKKGRKPEQPNQDNVIFCRMGDLTICGVADGHGPDGHWASHWAARYVLKLLLDQVKALGRAPDDNALTRIFDITHEATKLRSKQDNFDLTMSGSTLTICVIDHKQKSVASAWVGDSRCGLGRPGGVKGQSLTMDHKPQDELETARIVASGGEVVQLPNDVPHRVFIRGGQVPGLAMSRAVGDLIAHSVGVVHSPGIARAQLQDHFVLCCSDGVWEFIESDEAGAMVSKFGRAGVGDACEMLMKESRKRWLDEEQSLTDDISGIIIWI